MESKNLIYHILKEDCSKEELEKLHAALTKESDQSTVEEVLNSAWEKTSPKNIHNLNKSFATKRVMKTIKPEKSKPTKSHTYISARRKRKSYSLSIATSILAITLTIGYFLSKDNVTNPVENRIVAEQIVKETPRGHRSSIVLRDGSKVTLNSESRITYDENFGLTNRNIHLEGEGFFDVAKNENLPFTVISKNLETRAIGTSFNVRDYGDEKNASIALATGIVDVKKTSDTDGLSKLILKPNEQIVLDKASQEWMKSSFITEKVLSWKENKLYFNDMSLAHIIRTLERWYDVKIEVRGSGFEKLKYQGTGTFERQSLENILISLGYTMGFESRISEKQIMIKLTN